MPRLSVVTPCYNSARFIGRTIESLQAQTFGDWEHIVVDDGSTDDSAALVAGYAAQDSRVRLIQQTNGHVCNARNNGFSACAAESEYLLFLDSDDILEPRAVEKMLSHLDKHPEAALAYCSVRLIGVDDQPIRARDFERWWDVRYAADRRGARKLPSHVVETPLASLVASFRAIPSTAFIRRRVYEATSGWDEAFRHGAEDLDLVVQVALRAPVHFVPLRLVQYRRHDTNFSNQDFRSGIAQLRRKWWMKERLEPAQQLAIRDAFRFADEVVALDQGHVSARDGLSGELGRGILQLCGVTLAA
jgi:glycosyltransferase involved in cell wall biosynthesis